jgi:hypothetical protein
MGSGKPTYRILALCTHHNVGRKFVLFRKPTNPRHSADRLTKRRCPGNKAYNFQRRSLYRGRAVRPEPHDSAAPTQPRCPATRHARWAGGRSVRCSANYGDRAFSTIRIIDTVHCPCVRWFAPVFCEDIKPNKIIAGSDRPQGGAGFASISLRQPTYGLSYLTAVTWISTRIRGSARRASTQARAGRFCGSTQPSQISFIASRRRISVIQI